MGSRPEPLEGERPKEGRRLLAQRVDQVFNSPGNLNLPIDFLIYVQCCQHLSVETELNRGKSAAAFDVEFVRPPQFDAPRTGDRQLLVVLSYDVQSRLEVKGNGCLRAKIVGHLVERRNCIGFVCLS